MFRGVTPRTVVSLLAAVLLGLQVFVSTASFASAHTARHAAAKSQPGIKPSGKALRYEIATCRDAGRHGDPTGPLGTGDRHRTAADCAPETPDRPRLRQGASKMGEPGTPRTAHHSTSTSSTSHCPAALQVFRC
ncbi:hypothetical protein C1J00_02825 [Streptomyces cahuitamycinicus]|uniref:Secreted protein n=1 Tax=Streptomyces cahuitamycinicus TaxID=2070367 RepID=A0A2N8TXA9_9ACTN|nr:hypothetical protein [Streptomyces cahuitamycinicus]PNG23647.1 hypothetical protein C1J00_02825 [Streptomyces cahuitamycinicus]